MPIDAEQEYAQMDYRICGELRKFFAHQPLLTTYRFAEISWTKQSTWRIRDVARRHWCDSS